MGNKTRRLEKLAAFIAAETAPELKADITRTGRLSKADLVSEMVYEFDDLQGKMGGIYARRQGESRAVADALYEQYLPVGQDSPVPALTELNGILPPIFLKLMAIRLSPPWGRRSSPSKIGRAHV